MIDKIKLEDFWYYNKVKVFIAVIIIITLVIVIRLTGGSYEPDVVIAYVTDGRTISEEMEEGLNEFFAASIKDVNGDKKKRIDFVSLMGPRVYLEFVSDTSQIVLMDRNSLRTYINSGAFEPIDDLVSKYKMDFSNNPEVKSKTVLLDEVRTYAVPMGYIPFLLDVGFPAQDYYLTIRVERGKSKSAAEKNMNAHAIVDVILGYEETAMKSSSIEPGAK